MSLDLVEMRGMVDELFKLQDRGSVVRYHLADMPSPQDIGRHQWAGAAMILLFFSTTRPELLAAFLLHDMHEHRDGDMPSTTKWASPVMAEEYERLAKEWNSTHPMYEVMNNLSELDQALLVFFDRLEGALWCRKEFYRFGSRVAGTVGLRYLGITKTSLEHINELNPDIGAMLSAAVFSPQFRSFQSDTNKLYSL